ncbi:hypothetical protein BDR03DRAFT_1017366 [Suillus americanus]|nr:hypothetical protein BDR03DRAFT_1017366 [Suillus americanus]
MSSREWLTLSSNTAHLPSISSSARTNALRSSPPVALSPDVVVHPGILDNEFEPPTQLQVWLLGRKTYYSFRCWPEIQELCAYVSKHFCIILWWNASSAPESPPSLSSHTPRPALIQKHLAVLVRTNLVDMSKTETLETASDISLDSSPHNL